MRKIITVAALVSLLGACQKKDDTVADPQQVSIVITTPTNGQVFHKGDTVHIKGAVNYITELHGYEVRITDTANGTIVYNTAQHVHSDKFTISEYWVDDLADAAALKLEVISIIDHDGTTARQSVLFTINP